jgi:uncharacterized damage-inducible protein DinB
MNRELVDDLLSQFHKTTSMVRFTIGEFDEEEWTAGISWFQTPARVSYHLVEALDAYFFGNGESEEFAYGSRFGGPWWELNEEQLPSREEVLTYVEEIGERIDATFASITDEELSAPFELYDWSGKTLLGHLVYALRHTMHHQGALSALSTYHGHEGENWE